MPSFLVNTRMNVAARIIKGNDPVFYIALTNPLLNWRSDWVLIPGPRCQPMVKCPLCYQICASRYGI